MAAMLCELLFSEAAAHATVNIAAGRAWSVAELVEHLRSVSGRPLEIRTDPAKVRRSDRPLLAADTTLRRELIPNVRVTPLDDGLRSTLAAEGLAPTAASPSN